MSHPFGDLVSQYLHRKHGLSQAKLAEGILQDPSIIGKMCKGKRLNGPQAWERVCAIIAWLRHQAVLTTIPRHQTMYSALIWSYRLLSLEEQQLLAQASVFAGGWTLEAAQEVCADSASAVTQTAVATLLQQLNDKSWMLIETVNEHRRYRLLEPVRQFAAQQLLVADNGQRKNQHDTQRAHSFYYLTLFGEQRHVLESPQQRAALDIIATDFENSHPCVNCRDDRRTQLAVAPGKGDGGLGACEGFVDHHESAIEHLQQGLQYDIAQQERTFAFPYLGNSAIERGEVTHIPAMQQEVIALCRQSGGCQDSLGRFYL